MRRLVFRAGGRRHRPEQHDRGAALAPNVASSAYTAVRSDIPRGCSESRRDNESVRYSPWTGAGTAVNGAKRLVCHVSRAARADPAATGRRTRHSVQQTVSSTNCAADHPPTAHETDRAGGLVSAARSGPTRPARGGCRAQTAAGLKQLPGSNSCRAQTWKDEPQPQVPDTFGLPNLKPEPCAPST